ncbi:MAG: bifunctional 5,10-methylene-tetrahydrofolate dehydrogenase/5,10-methylene-tetrahydrofolate cyclohydrolase, partial [Rhizobacter sp.]|nr:bifunctional 5,10-methylene-tetrahydrofolate dehydrogenase/5,10-methylene-tetrahydrofolate cyclohydrolase [Chlorobiales bacterium]
MLLIDGKKTSDDIKAELRQRVAFHKLHIGKVP